MRNLKYGPETPKPQLIKIVLGFLLQIEGIFLKQLGVLDSLGTATEREVCV